MPSQPTAREILEEFDKEIPSISFGASDFGVQDIGEYKKIKDFLISAMRSAIEAVRQNLPPGYWKEYDLGVRHFFGEE